MSDNKAREILKAILDLANSGKMVAFEADIWGDNTLTVYIDDAHSHVGVPASDGTFEVLLDNLHGLLVEGCGLSFVKEGRPEGE